jgi:dipeptidyl aminopeptidase/acylaminoacyl peptidase
MMSIVASCLYSPLIPVKSYPKLNTFRPAFGLIQGMGKLMAIALVMGLNSCQDTGFIAPLPQDLGSSLNTTRNEQNSRLSYDGRYLVFASDREKQRGIWLYDLVARRLIPLPGVNQPNNFQDQPDISADGRYLVYVSEQSGKSSIWFYDRQTFEAENITQNWLGEVRRPSISGNGRFISFETNRSGQWDLVIYDRGLNLEISLPKDGIKKENAIK